MNQSGFSDKDLYEKVRERRERTRPRRFLHGRKRGSGRGKVAVLLQRIWDWIKTPRTKKEWLILLIKTGGTVGGIGLLYLIILWFSLPSIDNPQTLFAAESTVILDRNGTELYRVFSGEDRTYVPLNEISPHVAQATIAIEDERFFERGCFDAIGFTRALLSQFIPGFVRSGGSTLTQQFAGNAVVGRQRTITRKIRELMLACQLEQRYDKDRLLELYLNWIPYGQSIYGVEQAAHEYFGISAMDLSVAQGAIIAALTQRPSYFNPYGNHVHTEVADSVEKKIRDGIITDVTDIDDDDIIIGLIGQTIGSGANTLYIGGRTDQVLQNMQNLEMITEEERIQAVEDLQSIVFEAAREDIRAPHFVLWVREQTEELLNAIDENILEAGGLTISTTLDWNLQQAAETTVNRYSGSIVDLYEANNLGLLSIDPETREVLAYVGNRDYYDEESEGKIDMVQVPRQPGSSFKTFVYALAFEKGYSPASVIYDVDTEIGDDSPQNFDGQFMGLMTMRRALAHSRNIPAAKTFFLAGGEDEILSFADSIGIPSASAQKEEFQRSDPDFAYGWPLALGSAEVPLSEMVQGYATFADEGQYMPLVSITKITDSDGNILYEHEQERKRQVVDERIAAQITSVLSDIDARPANEYWRNQLTIPGYTTAAKTGTSNKCLERDTNGNCTLRRPESAWTIGYTPNLVTGVWVGNATSESLAQKAGGLDTASPIWREYMIAAHRELENTETAFSEPSGIVRPQVSLLSGKLPAECTPVNMRKADMFLSEFVPKTEDDACARLEVDKVTNLLASDACPADAREERAFFIPHSELPDRFPKWEAAVQAWAERENEEWYASETHSGSMLPLPFAPTEKCDPALTPGRFETPIVQIQSPRSNDNVEYPIFTVDADFTSTAQITSVKYYVDDRLVREETRATPRQRLRVPAAISEGGTHTLRVVIENEFFTTAEDSIQFRFGNARAPINTNDESSSSSSIEEISRREIWEE